MRQLKHWRMRFLKKKESNQIKIRKRNKIGKIDLKGKYCVKKIKVKIRRIKANLMGLMKL
jgi:hypothetical protein